MCGRLNVTDDPLVQQICDFLGIDFSTTTNIDLRPTQQASSLIMQNGNIQQLNSSWGIKPDWSKKILINAQAETVATKKTFKHAFETSRCIVPCSGWYEWRDEGGKRKQQYIFEHADNQPFYMAGVYYHQEQTPFVSLTIKPNEKCAEIHGRMPLLIEPNCIEQWLGGNPEQLGALMKPIEGDMVNISKYPKLH
jgi:putative SOS response-associated peptidase YedK